VLLVDTSAWVEYLRATSGAAGTPVCTLNDCLIAVMALRSDASLLARDRDFASIARHVPLRLEPVG
jgi:predicted nucleic acid-binding protein